MNLNVKEAVVAELEGVPPSMLPEVLRFVQFIKARASEVNLPHDGISQLKVVTVSASQVAALSGIADLTGDALADTERLYAE